MKTMRFDEVCFFQSLENGGRGISNPWKFSALALLMPGVAMAADSGVEQLRSMSIEQLMNTEVTSVSRSESTVADSPAAVTVITQEMIRRSGATAIPELFRMVPGLDVARIDGNKWAVGSRGFNNRYQHFLLVLVDGRSVYSPQTSGVFWDAVDVPLEDIERIEVIRGPGASVWGANAVNGVINIITKSAKDTQGGMISAGGGTQERAFGTFRYGGKMTDDLFYRVYGKGFDRDENISPDGDPNDHWRGQTTGLRMDWTPNDRDSLTLDSAYTRSVKGTRDRFPVTNGPPYAKYFPEDDTTEDGHVLGRWSRKTDADSGWTLQAYWEHWQINDTHNIRDSSFDTFDVDFQHQFKLGGRQKIVWGLGYRDVQATLHNSSEDGGFYLSWLDNHPQMHVFSSFVQDQISLVDKELSLTLGTKLEHNNFTGYEAQPSARLLWTPTKQQSVWAAASHALRTPSFTDDDAQFVATPANPNTPPSARTVANRNLGNEEVWAYELGYRVQATDAWSVDAALFYNDISGVRANHANPALSAQLQPPLKVASQFFNGLDGETYGAELSSTWQLTKWWRLYGAYTFLQMQLHADPSLPPASRKNAEAIQGQSPEHQVYLQSGWDLSSSVEFDLIGRYVDALSGFNPSGLPGVSDTVSDYISLDARLAWRANKNLEFSLVGQNLLDNQHAEFGTNPFVRSPLVELQRGVYGKVTWYW